MSHGRKLEDRRRNVLVRISQPALPVSFPLLSWSGKKETDHACETSFGEDEPLVDQAVKQFGGGLDNGYVGYLRRVFLYTVPT